MTFKILVVAHAVDQSLLAGAEIAEAENKCGCDAEDDAQSNQNADELQIAETRQCWKSLRNIPDQ